MGCFRTMTVTCADREKARWRWASRRRCTLSMGSPHLRIRQRALKALMQMGRPAVEALAEALDDDRLRVRQGVLEALEMIGEPAVLPLLKVLEAGNPRARWRAAEALGRLGDVRSVPYLVRALQDYTLDVRWKAAESLGMIGDRRCMEALIEAPTGRDSSGRAPRGHWEGSETRGRSRPCPGLRGKTKTRACARPRRAR